MAEPSAGAVLLELGETRQDHFRSQLSDVTRTSRAASSVSRAASALSRHRSSLRSLAALDARTCASTCAAAAEASQELLDELFRLRPDVKPHKHFNAFLRFWRRPMLRLSVTWTILALDWYNYLEDPVDKSLAPCFWTPVGQLLVILNWFSFPESRSWLAVLKPMLVGASCFFGVHLGRRFRQALAHRQCCTRFLKGARGTIIFPIAITAMLIVMSTQVWNLALGCCDAVSNGPPAPEARSCESYCATSNTWISNQNIGKACQILSWIGDVISVLAVLDIVMQELGHDLTFWIPFTEKSWRVDLSHIWAGPWRMVILWTIFTVASFKVVKAIILFGQQGVPTTSVPQIFGWLPVHRSECGRAVVSAIVFCLDLCTVSQDMDFPSFSNPLGIKAVGFNFVMDGKWLNYGMMYVVMGLDAMNLASQMYFYKPRLYGQYVGEGEILWRVTNHTLLDGLLHMTTPDEFNMTYAMRILEMACNRTCPADVKDSTECCGDEMLSSRFRSDEKTGWWWRLGPLFMVASGLWLLYFLYWALKGSPREMCRRVATGEIIWIKRQAIEESLRPRQRARRAVQTHIEAPEESVHADAMKMVPLSWNHLSSSGSGRDITGGVAASPSGGAEEVSSNRDVGSRCMDGDTKVTLAYLLPEEFLASQPFIWLVSGTGIYVVSGVDDCESLIDVADSVSAVPADSLLLQTLQRKNLSVNKPLPPAELRPIVFVVEDKVKADEHRRQFDWERRRRLRGRTLG
eukprot:TRINITY_DN40901_c0_g1_i1.p1 TRINITY_DN40901_c0_g1~~TRINITY_DN40901_c0_g1_i1.p1  ORF type:complete len:745 (-),score=101.46 TRINITY_DN40901_c0_g1_i1:21-2255(-)